MLSRWVFTPSGDGFTIMVCVLQTFDAKIRNLCLKKCMKIPIISDTIQCCVIRHHDDAGHSLIFSRFAIRSPLNFFHAHAFIFWISLFARRSTSGSLREEGLNHSSLSIHLSYSYIFCQTGIFAGFSLHIINLGVRISIAAMGGGVYYIF